MIISSCEGKGRNATSSSRKADIYNYENPIGEVFLSKGDCEESGELYEVKNLIDCLAEADDESKEALRKRFNDCGDRYENGITKKCFAEKLDRLRREYIDHGEDTEWIDTIISGNKSLRLGKRFKECRGIDCMVDKFVTDSNYQETVSRRFKTNKYNEGKPYEGEITIESFLDGLCEIKYWLKHNKKEYEKEYEKGHEWINYCRVDDIIHNLREFVLYGTVGGDSLKLD